MASEKANRYHEGESFTWDNESSTAVEACVSRLLGCDDAGSDAELRNEQGSDDLVDDPLGLGKIDSNTLELVGAGEEEAGATTAMSRRLMRKEDEDSSTRRKHPPGAVLPTSSSFDPAAFIEQVHAQTPIGGLERGLEHIKQSRGEQTSEIKALIAGNFDRFVSSRDAIQDIHALLQRNENESGENSVSTETLTLLLDEAEEEASRTFGGLLERQAKADEIRSLMSTLKSQSSILELPSRILEHLRNGEIRSVCREYSRAVKSAPQEPSSLLRRILNAASEEVCKLCESLKESMKEPALSKSAEKAIMDTLDELETLLSDAGYAGDSGAKRPSPLWAYLAAKEVGLTERIRELGREAEAGEHGKGGAPESIAGTAAERWWLEDGWWRRRGREETGWVTQGGVDLMKLSGGSGFGQSDEKEKGTSSNQPQKVIEKICMLLSESLPPLHRLTREAREGEDRSPKEGNERGKHKKSATVDIGHGLSESGKRGARESRMSMTEGLGSGLASAQSLDHGPSPTWNITEAKGKKEPGESREPKGGKRMPTEEHVVATTRRILLAAREEMGREMGKMRERKDEQMVEKATAEIGRCIANMGDCRRKGEAAVEPMQRMYVEWVAFLSERASELGGGEKASKSRSGCSRALEALQRMLETHMGLLWEGEEGQGLMQEIYQVAVASIVKMAQRLKASAESCSNAEETLRLLEMGYDLYEDGLSCIEQRFDAFALPASASGRQGLKTAQSASPSRAKKSTATSLSTSKEQMQTCLDALKHKYLVMKGEALDCEVKEMFRESGAGLDEGGRHADELRACCVTLMYNVALAVHEQNSGGHGHALNLKADTVSMLESSIQRQAEALREPTEGLKRQLKLELSVMSLACGRESLLESAHSEWGKGRGPSRERVEKEFASIAGPTRCLRSE